MTDKTVVMPSALTAENGAKSLMIGEFNETTEFPCPECCDYGPEDDCPQCDGTGEIMQVVPVTWTTIKEIYAMAVEHLSEKSRGELTDKSAQPPPSSKIAQTTAPIRTRLSTNLLVAQRIIMNSAIESFNRIAKHDLSQIDEDMGYIKAYLFHQSVTCNNKGHEIDFLNRELEPIAEPKPYRTPENKDD